MIFNSIRHKFLVATLTLVFLFTSLSIYLWDATTYRNTLNISEAYVTGMVRISTDNFESVIRDMNSIVASIASNKGNIVSVYEKDVSSYKTELDFLSDNRKIEDYIQGVFSQKKYVNGIMVSGLNGRTFINGMMPTLSQVKEQTWYEEIVRPQDRPIIVAPYYFDKSETADLVPFSEQIITVGLPILNSTNIYTTGFVIANISGKIIEDVFGMNLGNYGSFYIFDTDNNRVIYQPEKSNSANMITENNLEKMFEEIGKTEDNTFINIDRQEILVIKVKSDFTQWTTVAIIPRNILMDGFYQTRNINVMISIIFLLLATIIVYFITSALTENILKLNQAMQKIDKDTLDVPCEINSKDETRQLYQQFCNMIKRIRNLIEEIRTAEKNKRKYEIKALQSQINPHFLYNTLNTISHLADLHGSLSISKVSNSLSVLLHVNLRENSFITVSQEIEYLKSYITIQTYKYTNKFTADFEVQEDLKNFMILKLLLQPIVENAIVHGIAPSKRTGRINIKIFSEKNKLIISVRDNGKGISENRISEILQWIDDSDDSNIGLQNVRSRIKLYFGNEYDIEIISEPDIFTIVELKIPLINENEVENYV